MIPSELEGKIQEHPAVDDCCVVSRWDDAQATELPVAFVVLRPNMSRAEKLAAPENITKWLNPKVAAHKRMRGGIYVVDNIARNPSGKILRRIMRVRLKEQILSKL